MARKKEIKTGFHLKFIPAGREKDLLELATNYSHIKDKYVAFTKFVETFSSIVERCWNNDKEYVGVSERILSKKLGVNYTGAARLLKNLIEANFLEKNTDAFEIGKKAWDYKPLCSELDIILIYRNHLRKPTDDILQDFQPQYLTGDVKLYYEVLTKVKLSNDVYDFMNNISKYNISNNNCINGDSLVPECDSLEPYKVIGRIPTDFIPVYKLLAGRYRISRPNNDSRVYTNITNLARGYRQFLRLNSQPLVGFDIANSQPLIASVLFTMHSEKQYGYIKDDVQEYQRACESGTFYEYFMTLNGIDTNNEDDRTKFKKEFFGKVFYTKEVEKENYLKTQYKTKYPTCYDAIFLVKGGYYSNEYKEFPELMTRIETFIMFETNIELIKMGYDVVNIFDSLYSDSDEAIAKAKEIVINKFADFGIKPKLKDISYRPAKPIQCSIASIELINQTDELVEVDTEIITQPPIESITFNQFLQQHPYRAIMSAWDLRKEYVQKYFGA